MRTNDVKILWARSGNRCAYPECRTEMAPNGTDTTLGEIAHIVARSPDGPRGNSQLTAEERDAYDNLILLCPTHHTIIDDSPDEWTVEKVTRLKSEHEKWVTHQLEHGLTIRPFEFDGFLNAQVDNSLAHFAKFNWIYASLTPLSISDDTIEPKLKVFVDSVNSTRLPDAYSRNSRININLTRPNQSGIINDDYRDFARGNAHTIQLFRSGHVEMAISLQGITDYINSSRGNSDPFRLIHYTNISESLECVVDFLFRTWHAGLPFYNMVLTVVLSATANTQLIFNRRVTDNYVFSPSVKSQNLRSMRIVEKSYSEDELLHFALQRIVEAYGLDLPKLRDEDGVLALPKAFCAR